MLDEGGERLDFRRHIHSMELGRRDLVPGAPFAYWRPTGAIVTADRMEAEIATPPVVLGPGFATALDGWMAWERTQLAQRIRPHTLRGDSTHINVTLPSDVDPDAVADLFATRFSVGLMLLMDRPVSPGLLVRPRPFRLELGGEYVVGAALRAATTYAVGATLACVDAARRGTDVDLPAMLELWLERNVLRYGWYVARTAFGPGDLYVDGRRLAITAIDGRRLVADDVFRWGWAAARRFVGPYVDPADLEETDAFVDGGVPLLIERQGIDEATVARPSPAASPFGRALPPRERPGYDVAPVMVTWEAGVFLISRSDRGCSAFAVVPGRALDRFLSALDRGALDTLIHRYLATRPTGRRVLDWESARVPGLHDAIGLRAALLAPERDYWGQPMQLTVMPVASAGAA